MPPPHRRSSRSTRSAGRYRGLVAALIGLVALLAGCTSTLDGHGRAATSSSSTAGRSSPPASTSGGVTVPTRGPATFQDCSHGFRLGLLHFPAGRLAKLTFTCARIDVPLDYRKPDGPTIGLQLLRIHDTDAGAPRQLLVNPGGPGASGIEFALEMATEVSTSLLQHDDLIGFDPRGVGLSSPISCLSAAQKDTLNALSPDVLTSAGFDQARSAAKTVATACSAKYGSALADFTTVNTARDMDLIRQAVGDSRLNYVGFSYGTELGYEYAQLFPDRIQAMVLDGVVDPTVDPIASFTAQNAGFERAFDQFATWCRGNTGCARLGNPRSAVYAVQAQAKRSPIPTSTRGDPRKATFSLVTTGVLQALYSRSLWPQLATSLLSARSGNAAGLLSLADDYNERFKDGTYSNIAEANTTIGCNDQKPGPTDAVIRSTARSWSTRFPMFGLWNAASLFTCQQWQPVRTPLLEPTARTGTKVLVLGNIHDPATPYQNSQKLVSIMRNAELMSWNGQGHTSFLQGSSCVDTKVDAYLIGGTLPPADTVCQK